MNRPPLALRGRRVVLIGLGSRQGGVGVARYLVEQGAEVRVTDLRTADQLAASLADLDGLPIGWTLGEHREEDIAWADVVVRNPAVPAESPWLALARSLGKPVEMEMTLFFRACPAPIVGVTGTKGKTTTTTLLHAMLSERWPEAVLAGNMGVSALQQLPDLRPGVPVALELSSFQLEGLNEHQLSPHVAVLTNLSPDHLDRYPDFDAYAATKGAIFRWQTPRVDFAVFDPGDPRVKDLTSEAPGQWVLFGTGYRPGWKPDVWVEDGHFWAAWEHEPVDLGPTAALRVPGEHAQLNAMAAAAAALAVGVSAAEIRRAIAGFAGVPHRLEPVATIGGVEFVNDTAATAPAAAIAALRAFAGRGVVAISGGFDKRLPMEDLADELARSARQVILLDGTVTPTLARLLAERGVEPAGAPAMSMDEAVARAAALTGPGDVILLSPGCASFGLFRDEFHRGEAFRAAVRRLEGDA
ncbi:MAG TPA: UDP-N-acetylmuramoyl-L-alanine--D-glutamate ligase [Thermomicrobiales bacterium]|nr:UDP-N-acetylmuramoyl-L-alanine--D-glutamate ligase [Thermomicrobiales bacterium]